MEKSPCINSSMGICKIDDRECWDCNQYTSFLNEEKLFETISMELSNAINNFPSFHSLHEGYTVLLEEVDELWEHVKTNQKKRNPEEIRKECIQIASMAIRILIDCGKDNFSK